MNCMASLATLTTYFDIAGTEFDSIY
uniref:Uncharacterized protein n=1 Tax=Arundo donax TaxID=35708 RepID=A0A0A9A5D5_ARUDO